MNKEIEEIIREYNTSDENMKKAVEKGYKKGYEKAKEEIKKAIDRDIEIQEGQLTGDFEKDKPIKWRITGMEALKTKCGLN